VECVFDLLKKWFNILAIPGRSYSQCTLGLIMHDCIILHNIIIDDGYDENYHIATSVIAPSVNYETSTNLIRILQRESHLTSEIMFLNLESNLIKHVWNKSQ
jgi:hypothetical protein